MPATDQPIAELWSTETDLGAINAPLVSNGVVVVAAGAQGLTWLDAGSGAIRCRLPAPDTVTDMAATDLGPVMVHLDGDDNRLVAADWGGQVLWTASAGPAVGVRSMRGWGDRLLTTGVVTEPARQQVYRMWRATDGQVLGTLPGRVAAPEPTRFGLIYPVRSDEPRLAGLYVQPLNGASAVKLLPDSLEILSIDGDIAVGNTAGGSWEPSVLFAYDLAARRELWREPGGAAVMLAVDKMAVGCARFVEEGVGTVALRAVDTGALLWETAPMEMSHSAVLLLGDWLLVELNSELLQVYDRRDGRLLQELENEDWLTLGPCAIGGGLYDAENNIVRCLWRAP